MEVQCSLQIFEVHILTKNFNSMMMLHGYMCIFVLIVVYLKGLERIWFLTDEFRFRSFSEFYFQRPFAEFTGYTRIKYEVSGFINGEYDALDKNSVSQLNNQLYKAIKEQTYLPRILIIVPDDNLIQFIVSKNDTSPYTFGNIIHWLMMECGRAVKSQKDFLPEKSKHAIYPHFIWIEAPCHLNISPANNQLREKFNNCMRSMVQIVDNTSVLALKKIWNPADESLYCKMSKNFTIHGFKTYLGGC